MTIRHHLQTPQLHPVTPLGFSVNYTNHFLQDGSLGCRPGNLSICLIHEQVNRVSQELIQVAWIQGTGWALAKSNMLHFNLPSFIFFSTLFIVIHTTSCLSSSPVCLSVLQLSNYPAADL